MRYSIPVKFITVLLAAVALTVAFISAFGIVQVADLGLYSNGLDSWIDNRLQWQARDLAQSLTERYAVKSLTNCPEELLEELGYWYVFEDWTGLQKDSYNVSVSDNKGNELASQNGLLENTEGYSYKTVLSVQFPVMVTTEAVINELYGKEYLHRETVYSDLYDGKPVTIRYYESPEYKVQVTLDSQQVLARSGSSLELIRLVYEQRYNLMILLVAALVLFAGSMVYICCVAGRSVKDGSVTAGGMNKIPLDVYAAVGTAGGWLLGRLVYDMILYWIYKVDNLNAGTLAMTGLVIMAIAVIAVGFLFALVAQIKDGSWWKRSVLCWLWNKLMGWLRSVAGLLPLIWKYLLIGIMMGSAFFAGALVLAYTGNPWLFIVAAVAALLVILYGGYAYGVIIRGAEKMVKGKLTTKIDTRFLLGTYGKCAQHMNTLADVATEAAKKQMQSERLKTELVTNVTHDIKTPLTSIINYVDILQRTKDAQEAQQYLQVLGRQSQRLKKLIEDLIEMSKASTGNIAVNITQLDMWEMIHQALGEFSDKLEGQNLQVVLDRQEGPAMVYADGRFLWRVISNLLSNIVKYSMPDTRVYIDVTELENRILVSIKNISREPLNMTPEELTERFVRGDVSRNTEGSGLGLNIAKSLMELQKGQMKLFVDGDLFKVTLILPKA